MQAKYGLNPQFPINRYVNGLTSGTVPDRTGEYPSGAFELRREQRLRESALRGLGSRRARTCRRAWRRPRRLRTSPSSASSPRGRSARRTSCSTPSSARSVAAPALRSHEREEQRALHVREPETSPRGACRLTGTRILGTDPDKLQLHWHRPAHGRVVPAALRDAGLHPPARSQRRGGDEPCGRRTRRPRPVETSTRTTGASGTRTPGPHPRSERGPGVRLHLQADSRPR